MARAKRLWTWLIGLAALAIVIGGSMSWSRHTASKATSSFRSVPISRSDLVATVSATGTIEPEEVVDVGAQVIGMIQEFGRDLNNSTKPIDYLSEVEQGTVLARIDDTVYRARLDKSSALVGQAEAQLAQERANLQRSEADVLQMKAKLHQAERDLARIKTLHPTGVITDAEFDATQATFDVATATLTVSVAAVEQSKASVNVAERALAVAKADQREAQQNLDYTIIPSPVKGVIVDRRVNVGQTVVSSLNAPSLFLIAQDLTRLQVWASVNEADIGRIRRGQMVRFTVDAFPDEVFNGVVSQVRLNATMTQNVVTYTVVVDTDNPGGKLLPYLTANLLFEYGRVSNALLIPNAALRWHPQPDQIAPEARQAASTTSEKRRDRGQVWVEEGRYVRPVEVHLGLTDGLSTEIVGGELQEVQRVVIGAASQSATDAASPFAPRMFGGGRK